MAVIPHPPYSPYLALCDFFLFPKMKLKLKGLQFDTTEEIQTESQSAWHSDRKGLPGRVPKMEETVGTVSTCGRELLRGWWRPIGLMLSFIIFNVSVRNILDTPSYTDRSETPTVSTVLRRMLRSFLYLLRLQLGTMYPVSCPYRQFSAPVQLITGTLSTLSPSRVWGGEDIWFPEDQISFTRD
jgi:hypothetical protein